jgi:predicted RNA binding protein YcfA (HicA-like mRNA interferase family)
LIRRLKRADFEIRRIWGSHHFMQHVDGRTTVEPVHGNETIGPGLLIKFLSDCEMTPEDIDDLG